MIDNDTFATVSQGGPPPEEDIPDGVYLLQLVKIGDPRTVTAKKGPNAGKDFNLIDWGFAIEAPGTPYHDRLMDDSTSTASGPRSKMYEWLTALLGGVPPQAGRQMKRSELIGRLVLGTVNHDDGGWPRIASLSAVPASMLGQQIAQATGAPVAGAPVAAPAPVAPLRAPEPAPTEQLGAFVAPAGGFQTPADIPATAVPQAQPAGPLANQDDLPF